MPEQFVRKTVIFGNGGVNYNAPVDLCPEDQYPYTKNVYSSQAGSVQTRPGLTQLSAVSAARVNAKRVNNSIPGVPYAFQRFVADSAGNMHGGINGDVLLDSGFSGNPPAMVTAAPAQSPEVWMYAADSQRMRKFRTDQSTVQNIGILPPRTEPRVTLGQPQYKRLLFGTPTPGGIAGAFPAAIDRMPTSTTIRSILYDVGTTGWACVSFTNPAGDYSFIGRGAEFTVNGVEAPVMEQTFTTLSSTTVAAIKYDSGTTGFCTIQMATPFSDLERNQMLQFPSEYVRVLTVTKGPDGLFSFRCITVGTVNAGDAINSIPAVRAYLHATHAAGEPITAVGVQDTFTLVAGTTQGTGTLTVVSSIDLSQMNNRPISQDDYMHVSLKVDHPEYVLYGRFLLDVDNTTNDFTRNFYYQPFEHNDFTAASQGTSSQTAAQQTSIGLTQARAYDLTSYLETGELGTFAGAQELAAQEVNPYAAYPISTSMQASTGQSVWTEFLFKISELQRVGSDDTRSLANVAAFRLELTVSNTVTVSETAWWVTGTYGPDILDSTYGVQGFPILVRYRYRNSLTGAISVQSPALRSGVLPRRNTVICTPTVSPDPQCDYIDWEFFGGINETWHYGGSQPNAVGNFTLDLTETARLANDPLSSVCFPPVPASDVPHHSLVSVVGTAVTWVAGDQFNLNWVPGGQILIDTKAYTLYSSPVTGQFLHISENAGVLPNVQMTFAEPEILGQPVPLLWGPDQQNRYFYAGDPLNPGVVYPSNADADGGADGVSDQTTIPVGSPSDPIMNGCIIEDVSMVLTANTIQRLQPTPGETTLSYTPVVLEIGKGLYCRWGLVVHGNALYYIGNDGIYRWSSNAGSVSITEERLAPIFPHASIPGRTLTLGANGNGVTIYPPDYSQPNSMRLGAGNGYIFFDYLDINGNSATLAYREANQSWWPWQYVPPPPEPPVDQFVNDERVFWTYQFFSPEAVAIGGTPGLGHACAWAAWDFKPNPGALWSADQTYGVVTPKTTIDLFGKLIGGWTTNYTDLGIPSTPANDALFAVYQTDVNAAKALFKQVKLYFFLSGQVTTPNVPATGFRSYLDIFEVHLDLSLLPSGTTLRLRPSTITPLDTGGLGTGGGTSNLGNVSDTDNTSFGEVYRDVYGASSFFTDKDKYGWSIVCTDFIPAASARDIATPSGAVFHYQEEGESVNTTLVGMQQGQLAFMSSGVGDLGNPIDCQVFTKAMDSGDPRSFKVYGDGWLKCNTQGVPVATSLLLDDYEQQIAVDPFSTAVTDVHFIDLHGNGNMHRNMALLLEWQSALPDSATQTLYYWEVSAWEVHPQTVQNWTSQATTHGLNGFQHIREVWFCYSSSTPFTLTITADGKPYPFNFPATGGQMQKLRIDTSAIKGKLFSYSTSAGQPITMYFDDLEVRVKEWASTGPFLPIKPFAS